MASGTPPRPSPLLASSFDQTYDQKVFLLDRARKQQRRTEESGSGAVSSSRPSPASSSSSGSSSSKKLPKLRGSTNSPPPVGELTVPASTFDEGIPKRYLKGRPPWYDESGSTRSPFIIGVAGGSGSGKTTVCAKIIEKINVRWVTSISMDSFYRGLSPEERSNAHNYDFDHPSAIDFAKLVEVLNDLRQGKRTSVPIYDFVTHSRLNHSTTVYGADVIIIEGILLLYDEALRNLLDMKIFVDTASDVRLARRLRRDTRERGRTAEGILEQYERFVKPAYDEFVHPTKDFAHLVIPYGAPNEVAIDVISGYVLSKLHERGYVASDPRLDLASFEDKTIPSNVRIMPKTNQSAALHLIIRDTQTTRDAFCFYADRLSRMAVEFALSFLPFTPKTVITPTGSTYDGVEPVGKICSVSIMRSGEAMERAIREVCSKVRIGKILIQSLDKKPRLFYCKLPKDIDKRSVLLLDPTLATGAALKMAIRVLLDHDVAPENIYVVTLIASLPGLHSVSYAYPSVNIITTEVDEVDSDFYCSPGVGNFGSRYFGDGMN